MKRSEMIIYMTQEYQRSYRGGMSEMSHEERMEFLLDRLEEAGMLPPPVPTGASGWDIGKGASAYVFAWDEE